MTDTTQPTADNAGRPRTRRALLGAALGAGAAVAANAIARPAPASATVTAMSTGQVNTADAITGLVFDTTGNVFHVSSVVPTGPVAGATFTVIGDTGTAVSVSEAASAGWGINLSAPGTDAIGIGIAATGANAKGMQVDGGAIGIQVSGQTTGGTGLDASAFGDGSVGVIGYGATGVLGEGQGGIATSVGVRGKATTGTGGLFEATTGTAIQAIGKVKLSRSGTASIGAGKTSVDVSVPGGTTSGSMGYAVLRQYRSGVYVAAVYRVSSTGKLRIRLNKVASSTSSTSVAWFVLG